MTKKLPIDFFTNIEKYKDQYEFYKPCENSEIWLVDTCGIYGSWLFSFDKHKVYSLFNCHGKLTDEEKKLFLAEYPRWKCYIS